MCKLTGSVEFQVSDFYPWVWRILEHKILCVCKRRWDLLTRTGHSQRICLPYFIMRFSLLQGSWKNFIAITCILITYILPLIFCHICFIIYLSSIHPSAVYEYLNLRHFKVNCRPQYACVCVCVCVVSPFSRVCVTVWAVTHQAPLPMGFSRQEYWSGLPCPPLGDLPNPGIEPVPLTSLALAGGFFTTSATQEAQTSIYSSLNTS